MAVGVVVRVVLVFVGGAVSFAVAADGDVVSFPSLIFFFFCSCCGGGC